MNVWLLVNRFIWIFIVSCRLIISVVSRVRCCLLNWSEFVLSFVDGVVWMNWLVCLVVISFVVLFRVIILICWCSIVMCSCVSWCGVIVCSVVVVNWVCWWWILRWVMNCVWCICFLVVRFFWFFWFWCLVWFRWYWVSCVLSCCLLMKVLVVLIWNFCNWWWMFWIICRFRGVRWWWFFIFRKCMNGFWFRCGFSVRVMVWVVWRWLVELIV